MPFTTYSELQTAIASWLHRSDLTSQIPDFISLTEAKLQRLLKTGDEEASTTLSLTTTGSVALPTGFTAMRRLRYFNGSIYLDLPIGTLIPSDYDGVTQAAPRVASIVGNYIQTRPLPDQTYTLYLDYYASFTPLSDTDPSNWILVSHPDAYLYGALLQSAPYVGSDARIQIWSDAFQTAIDELERNDFEKRFSMVQARSDVIGVLRPPTFNINTGR